MRVLLLSHGNFAKEIYNTAKMIAGELENISYLTLQYGEDLEAYKKSICDYLDGDDQTLILCDLFGGSPFMMSSQIFGNPQYNSKVELVTGLNLPMLLEVSSQIPYKTLTELKETALLAGSNGVVDLRKAMSQ